MKRKQLLTYVLLGVGGVVLLSAAGLMVRSIMQYRAQEQAFTRLRSRLGQLYRSEVFPSQENVALEQRNREQLERWFDELITKLGEENVNRDDRSPSQFIGRLERTRAALRQQAERSRIRLPETGANFAFGFDRYAGTGELPSPEDVPRLTEQLIVITRLTRMLFDGEISALRAIERDVFEDAPAAAAVVEDRGPVRRGTAPPVRRDAAARQRTQAPGRPGILGEGEMFTTYRFVLEFNAREEALAKVLNALASDSLYIVVRTVRLRKDVADMVAARPVAPGAAAGGDRRGGAEADVQFLFGGEASPAPAASAAPERAAPVLGPSHPVSGIEMETPLQVRMEIDVYKFRSADETRD